MTPDPARLMRIGLAAAAAHAVVSLALMAYLDRLHAERGRPVFGAGPVAAAAVDVLQSPTTLAAQAARGSPVRPSKVGVPINAALFGVGVAGLAILSRRLLPVAGHRRLARLGLGLAAGHFGASALLFFWMLGTAGAVVSPWVPGGRPLRDFQELALAALHPPLLSVTGWKRIDAGDPVVVAIAAADSLVWGFGTAWVVGRLRRMLSSHPGRGLGDDDPPRPPHP